MRGWSSPGHLGSEDRGAGVLAVNGTAAFKAGFVPDDEALTLVIGLEPALVVQALVHDKAQTPSSAPPQPCPLPWWWSQGGVLRLGQRWSA